MKPHHHKDADFVTILWIFSIMSLILTVMVCRVALDLAAWAFILATVLSFALTIYFSVYISKHSK